jgi:hypothetical protein
VSFQASVVNQSSVFVSTFFDKSTHFKLSVQSFNFAFVSTLQDSYSSNFSCNSGAIFIILVLNSWYIFPHSSFNSSANFFNLSGFFNNSRILF